MLHSKGDDDVTTESPTAFLLGAGLTKDEANGIIDAAGVATMEDLCCMDECMVSEVAKETGLKLIPAKKLSNAIKELCKKMKGKDQILKMESKDNASTNAACQTNNASTNAACQANKKAPDECVIPAAVVVAVAADPPPLANTIECYGAIPKLLFLDMQQEDEEKVAAAVTELAALLNPSNANWEKNADQALSLGFIAIILLLMRKWHCNRSIQFRGCQVFMKFTSSFHPDFNAKHAVHIIQSGGIETIMAAMKSFPDDDDIHRKGFRAIGNAFYSKNNYNCGSGPTIGNAMACFVQKLNGIELVLRVMKKFPNNASVQQACLCVLQQLSEKQQLRNALKKGGTLSAVGEAAEKHDDVDSLQSAAAALFKKLS